MDKIKNNVSGAWKSVCLDLEKKLPGHAIHAWFDPIVAVGFQKKSFILEVPNQFSLEWIESHYKDEIKLSISDLFSKQIQYQLLVAKEKRFNSNLINSSEPALKTKIKRFNNLNNKQTILKKPLF